MGGHGGLNILPQKRWNVYGRENRLKVARDEAKYEEEQAAIRERAEDADRERRRQLLKERARQRYGDQQQLLGPADRAAGALEPSQQQQQQQLEWRQAPAADDWQTDGAAVRGLAAGQADHFAALEQQQQQLQRQQRSQKERGGREPEKKRRREQRRGGDGPPPTLAHLAAQLEGPPAADAAAVGEASGGGGADGADGARLQRFSLFAEEEALAAKRKNPEVEAEKRDERRRRGDPNTQTSDARFDEQFSFAHKLYGQAAVPWYAKKGSTLPSHDGDPAQQSAEPGGGRRQMWQWEMQARAALTGAGPLHMNGGPKGQQGQGLLAGVKVLPDGGAPHRRDQAVQSSSSDSSSSDSSSSDSSSSSSSDSGCSDSSSSSSDGSRRRRRRDRRRSGRRDKHGKVSKRRDKSKRRERRGGKGAGGGGSKAGVEELRLERLRREEAERARQQRVLAVAAGRDPALGGKRYHQGYGFGRQ